MEKTTKATPDEPKAATQAEVVAAPTPAYRVLRPWHADTLEAQLNAAAADGWRLAATVGSLIILTR
jgi:hypothetical protein